MAILLYYSIVNFNCGVIYTHFNYICILFSPPWRWPHEWPKHVCDHYAIKLHDMIYLLTAIGLTPGGSSTVHIYTLTIHRTTQW